jgi:hypothetical protein
MPDQTNIFDDMDALRRDSVQLKPPSKAGRNRRPRSGETFARIPHDRGLRLYGKISAAAFVILFELDRLILTSRGQNPIPLKHKRLYAVGMARSTINRALRQLQDVKVIRVERWSDGGDATLVTHLWFSAG